MKLQNFYSGIDLKIEVASSSCLILLCIYIFALLLRKLEFLDMPLINFKNKSTIIVHNYEMCIEKGKK